MHNTQQLQIYSKYVHTYTNGKSEEFFVKCVPLVYFNKFFKLHNHVVCTISSSDFELI